MISLLGNFYWRKKEVENVNYKNRLAPFPTRSQQRAKAPQRSVKIKNEVNFYLMQPPKMHGAGGVK